MIKPVCTIQYSIPADRKYALVEVVNMAAEKNRISLSEKTILVVKRSVDARKKPIKWVYNMEVYPKGEESKLLIPIQYKKADPRKQVDVIGCGPAGMFAALKLLEMGFKPVVWERGKQVKERRRDLVEITRNHNINPDSNYCFGEGGAGTYSDGKLYTRSKKRGSVQKALSVLVHHGASPDILIDAHPHIGTNKLPGVVEAMRETILANGGEIHFEKKVTDFKIENGKIHALKINEKVWVEVQNVILATGHSARDIYTRLHERGVSLDFKPFAVGVRVEHSQQFIDGLQYKIKGERPEYLPAASYSIVYNGKKHSAFSFCMCPGGVVAPCATQNGEIVTNGWSPSKRNNITANAGIVCQVTEDDLSKLGLNGPLAGMHFQQMIEKKAWDLAEHNQKAPAQLVKDFLRGKKSETLPKSSYIPGLVSVDLNQIFPKFVAKTLQEAFIQFNQKMKGFSEGNALLIAPETRTSSPVRIPRDRETLQHPEISNLYPCAEGAGYAGGIVSAAIDGENCAEAITRF